MLSEPDHDVEWEPSDNSDSSDDLPPAYSEAIMASKSGTTLKPVQDWTTSAETLSCASLSLPRMSLFSYVSSSARGHSPAHGSKPVLELSSSAEDHQSSTSLSLYRIDILDTSYISSVARDPTPVPHTHVNFQVPDADSAAAASGHNLAYTIQISSTASFQDGKDQICLAMRIHPANAKLGYR